MAYQLVLAAMSDPTRRRILERLRKAPSSVGALAKEFPVSRPAVSQHLRVLRDCGLAQEERQGNRRIYSFNFKGMAALRTYIEAFWEDALASFEEAAKLEEGGTHDRK